MLKRGNATIIPTAIKPAGLIRLFQRGFFAAELSLWVIMPPDRLTDIGLGQKPPIGAIDHSKKAPHFQDFSC
jgi:hypothetical protein